MILYKYLHGHSDFMALLNGISNGISKKTHLDHLFIPGKSWLHQVSGLSVAMHFDLMDGPRFAIYEHSHHTYCLSIA